MNGEFHVPADSDEFRRLRQQMVERQLRPRGINDEVVLEAMGRVRRHAFVPDEFLKMAYIDGPLPIGEDQTISQPYIVAVMSQALQMKRGQRVLEIGTGCGYQAAVLAVMGLKVFTIEFLPDLASKAEERLHALGYEGIEFRVGDGRLGWPEQAPFDGIIVTAAPADVPVDLFEQLSPGGRLVIPVGQWDQELRVYRKLNDESVECEVLFPVRFVPLV
jgi:protein-L-isoaspartate(D-aspartate) O-methyltransferase